MAVTIVTIGIISLFLGHGQHLAWIWVEFVQFLLLLPMINHVTGVGIMRVLEGLIGVSFDLEFLKFLQLPIWEPTVLNKILFP